MRLPNNKEVVNCKWVLAPKYNSDGTLERHNSRLVAWGFTQSYAIDYFDTFEPMAKLNTVHILVALAVIQNWEIL